MRAEWAGLHGDFRIHSRHDAFGPILDLTVGEARQRLRWIKPGRFSMGVPDGEGGRFINEGPAHEVTLTVGFWLFDTACTQRLWREVLANNPSRFRGDALPVEQVSWADAQVFSANLNEIIAGLSFDLPTEAQWEYACRAGSCAPYAYGDTISPADARILREDPAAWDEPPQGTAPVMGFRPNAWGLYQMHGNVWEWCKDGLREYQSCAVEDPVGGMAPGAPRAIRGGSWGCDARHARSGYRAEYPPESRNGHLGLRCVCIGLPPAGDVHAARL